MKKLLTKFIRTYFAPAFEMRVRLFHVLAMGGLVTSLMMAVTGIIYEKGIANVTVNLIVAALSYALLAYSRRSGRYQVCYIISIVGVFLIFFPVLFFSSGGYNSGMPAFFVFAVVFTVIMLEGKKAVLFSVAELLMYITVCLVMYSRPEFVKPFAGEFEMLMDNIIAFVVVSIILGVSIFLHFRLYNEQQRKLSEQNEQLEKANAALSGLSRMKTELFANISHEMKTPLAVVSAHVQRAARLSELAREGDAEKIQESFALVQDEIMRMSSMVNNAIRLAAIQESGSGKVTLPDIILACAKAHTVLLDKNGNSLETDIPDTLPQAVGGADEISQVVSNLILNANTHTQNGVIRLCAETDGETLTVAVEDNGAGIPTEILTSVFERGVTDGSGSGLGLSICRQIVNSYGGEIHIESEPGKGTKAIFTLPVLGKERADG